MILLLRAKRLFLSGCGKREAVRCSRVASGLRRDRGKAYGLGKLGIELSGGNYLPGRTWGPTM